MDARFGYYDNAAAGRRNSDRGQEQGVRDVHRIDRSGLRGPTVAARRRDEMRADHSKVWAVSLGGWQAAG
jgi:hypothetical protein